LEVIVCRRWDICTYLEQGDIKTIYITNFIGGSIRGGGGGRSECSVTWPTKYKGGFRDFHKKKKMDFKTICFKKNQDNKNYNSQFSGRL
jgi:hypothetical protein